MYSIEFLDLEDNNNFNINKNGDLYNINKEELVYKIKNKNELKLNEYNKIELYKTGALIKTFIDNIFTITFINNNGEIIYKEMIDNYIDINKIEIYPCKKGILNIISYKKDYAIYKFISYDKKIVTGYDIYDLIDKLTCNNKSSR